MPHTLAQIQTNHPLFAVDYKVYINHTDAGGIVYHANHLTFFENCRRDWLSELGFDGYFLGETTDGNSIHFVVSHADLRYHRPILLDDVIEVRIDNIVCKPASIICQQSIYRKNKKIDAVQSLTANYKPYNDKTVSELLCQASITLACVQNSMENNTIHAVKIPQYLKETLYPLIS